MEAIQNVIAFVKENWVNILAIIGALDIILGIVVKWTKATWDDSVYALIHSWISKLGPKK